MAKNTWKHPIDKYTDWGGDTSTNNLPVSGEMVQKFIKDALEGKAGLFHYDATNNRYLVFADADTRDEYLADPNKTELIIGTFDAPFNFTAEISLTSPVYNAVFLGSAGNYIDFTFDIKNKQGASTGENVTVTYTFIRNATRQEVKETRKFGDAVRFNVDKYLGEGTNTVIVGIVGQTSLAATTVAITYQVVNLVLTDKLDISKSYNLSSGAKKVEVPFTVSGYGTKIVEWYLDGVRIPFVKAEDEIVDVRADRTKYITLSNLQQGTHSLQLRAYTVVNGEQFYTDTLYRDIMVYTGANSNVILGVAATIPRQYGILGANDRVSIYDMIQFVPYTLRFATYSPSNAANTEVVVSLDGKEMGRVGSVNNVENRFVITPSTAGTKTLKLSALNVSKEYQAVIKETDMDINEIDSGLVLNFTAEGKTYNSPDRGYWTDGVHKATLSGFNWNATSGWWNGRLEMSAGSSIQFDYAPLKGNPTNTGKTIEIEWSTKNVTNDDAVICDLRGDNGVGILITATKVSMKSADGVIVETEYKSDENVRIGFVINQSSGTTNQRLSFIYANGIMSRGEKWAQADSYTSDKLMKFTATEEAEISLKSIRIYDTALTSDNMLNNYILYRDTVSQMLEAYDRNDVYEEGTTTFSPDKMMGRLPVMIVTGDIPILENTSDKDTQIVVDIDYYNMQDTSKSFRMTGAAMRPQGTSSMGYPKKNFRIYTQEVEGTVLYDAEGKVVEDKLYSFKKGAQPVNCWCLKADYAESSGTHNTGIARLWNEALMNAQIEGEYVCRTGAQKAALAAKYKYDVRTTIDGFPILLFYRPSANDDVIFIGKYNFNNDKSTESVFGFTGIPGFDNSNMQCWEVLNNGNPLALFTTVANFDRDWAEAFESRYPDTKTPYTGDLKAFCQWMVNVSQTDFATEKWQHLNVYMMAAYWCYLMRHAAADQFVKNAMFTSEDGEHFYYILYDNDTINGLINTGRLRIKPTDDRQTVDETGSYVFAGHDSRLWNMLENDEEFISIVSAVDNALYSAGISYANTIKIFDEEQADKWVERVYNQDAQYKYVGPYVEKGIDNLFMLQGKRDLHRKWWLAKRFSIYDAKYVSGMYKSQAIEIKCLNETVPGQRFSIVAGYPLDYGYGINDVPRTFGVSLNVGDKHTFETRETINLGDPVRIYAAPHLSEVDFSLMSDRLAVVTIANVYDESLGTKMTRLILGNANKVNAEVTEISGLKQAMALEYLDVQGMTKIYSLDLSNHQYFKTLKAMGSGISSVAFANGAPVERLELPATMRVLSLAQLPHLASDNVVLENIANLQSISILACPNLSDDFDFVYDWIDSKTTDDRYCSLVMDGVDWHLSNADKFMRLLALKTNGGTFSIKGKVRMDSIKVEQIYAIRDILGESSFDPNAEFYVDIPSILQINSADSVLEGNSLQFTASLYPMLDGQYTWSLESGRSGCTIDQNGLLTTEETALDTSDVVVKVVFVANDGETLTATKAVSVVRRTYPQNIVINGAVDPRESAEYTWSHDTEGVNGEYSVVWSLEGDMDSYWRIASSDSQRCVLEKIGAMPSSVSGTIKVSIVRNFDNGVASVGTLALSLSVVFPADATIEGHINPIEKPNTYTWSTTTEGVNGEMYATWSLSGDVTSVVRIASQDSDRCVMELIEAPTEIVSGLLTLTLHKTADDSIVVTTTKELEAMMEGIIMTNKTNPIIQAILYSNGLVANETYTLKEEAELITASQLKNALMELPIESKDKVTQFDEFQYFTGVTEILERTFNLFRLLASITLPPSITSIGDQAFVSCLVLSDIKIPEGVKSIGRLAFQYCRSLTSMTFPQSLSTIGENICVECYALSKIYGYNVENEKYLIKNGILYLSVGGGDHIIPNSVTSIAGGAFTMPSSIESIVVHDKVQLGTAGLFGGCTGQCFINSSIDVKDYRNSPFYSAAFTKVTIGGKDTIIGYESLGRMDNLLELVFEEGVISIGYNACICPNIKSLHLPKSLKETGGFIVTGNSTSVNNTVDLYYAGDIEDFLNIATISSGLSSPFLIRGGYYFHCEGKLVTNCIIPEGVKTIPSGRFSYIKSIERVVLPSTLEGIGELGFAYCSSVKNITSLCEQAPICASNSFGYDSSSYIGRDTYNSNVNTLYVPVNATGYEEGYWLDPLQNTDKCGFSIYGKIVINANKLSYYNITYVTVDNILKTIRVSIGTHYINDVQYNTEMTITVVDGGEPNEGVVKTFIYNDSNQMHTYTFGSKTEPTWITIDQSITDPSTMISGDVNGEHIQNILNNTHRYLGKYTASGKMTLCQLSDTDSTKYSDGTTASTTGSEGDVFVKLPRFWYACLEESTDVWKIGFFFGDEAPTESYWNEWDGNDLLGAYDGYIVNSKMYSQSGRTISSKTSLSSANSAATSRGTGFSTLSMKWYNMLYLLYYARYGTTNFASKYTTAIGTSYTTGASNSEGMTDSTAGNNFCGVEALVRSGLCNYIGNVLLDFVSTTTPRTHKWKITESDGGVREVIGTIEGGYVQKMVFGANADIIPAMGNGTSSQGFCVNFTRTASSNRAVYVSLGFNIYANVPNNNSASIGRLAFRGTIIEETDPAVFKSLTAIG